MSGTSQRVRNKTPTSTRIVRLIQFHYIDSHNPNASIQDGITLIIYALEYLGDSLANPIKINIEWQIRRPPNVRPPASSEHQKRHGGNNISSENEIINGDINPRII